MRIGEYSRQTKETEISIKTNVDGTGIIKINTGINYFDHLLKLFVTKSLIDLNINAQGDLRHHIIEDSAICLGRALRNAIGEGLRINRFGFAIVPIDDALAFAALDLVKRPYVKLDLNLQGYAIEDIPQEDILHFLETFSTSLQATLHIWVQYGTNNHHKVEAAFKALAIALKHAVKVNPRRVDLPSAKGAM